MKTKKFIAIKILCFALSGLLLTSSVFVSGAKTMTVQAETNEGDLTASILYFIMSVLGAIARKDPISLMNAGASGATLISTITNYVKDNGDGTYTIDEELFQEVLNAMNEVESSMFSDDDVTKFFSGDAVTYNATIYSQYLSPSNNVTYTDIWTLNALETYPICAVYISGGSAGDRIMFYYNSTLKSYSKSWNRDYYVGDSLTSSGSKTAFSINLNNHYDVHECDYALNFPIFSNTDDAQAYLTNGAGYEKALNYTDSELFEYSSYYTGTYNGGDFTVSYNTLSGLDDKINELNETDKTTDEKIDELQDYINGADDGISGGTGGIGDITVSGGDSGDSGATGGNGLGGFLSGLGSIGDAILSILGKLLEYIGKALELFTDTITKVLDIIPKGFTGLLMALFPFVPQEWIVAIELTLVLGIVLMIVKAFRK